MKNIRVFVHKIIHVRKKHKYVMRTRELKNKEKCEMIQRLHL